MSALIFVAVAVAWAVYLVPKALRHHEEDAASRTVEHISDRVRVLARRDAVSARTTALVPTGRPVEAPAEAPAGSVAAPAAEPAGVVAADDADTGEVAAPDVAVVETEVEVEVTEVEVSAAAATPSSALSPARKVARTPARRDAARRAA
ncbi:hypothetical protein ABLM29_21660, partial [Nocardioides sp. YIM 152588]